MDGVHFSSNEEVGGVTDGGAHSDSEWVDIGTIGPHIDFMCDFILQAARPQCRP